MRYLADKTYPAGSLLSVIAFAGYAENGVMIWMVGETTDESASPANVYVSGNDITIGDTLVFAHDMWFSGEKF